MNKVTDMLNTIKALNTALYEVKVRRIARARISVDRANHYLAKTPDDSFWKEALRFWQSVLQEYGVAE